MTSFNKFYFAIHPELQKWVSYPFDENDIMIMDAIDKASTFNEITIDEYKEKYAPSTISSERSSVFAWKDLCYLITGPHDSWEINEDIDVDDENADIPFACLIRFEPNKVSQAWIPHDIVEDEYQEDEDYVTLALPLIGLIDGGYDWIIDNFYEDMYTELEDDEVKRIEECTAWTG
ncbi:MAG: hypothetical protein HRT89_04050 [Lentisphaeria bacterium]|nr:hypothetical protein [Lentisphaeria bacterium]